MARNRDELKKGLPKLESMLIDFLLDSGIGPKHIKGNIVLQYAPKIQELCDSITKIRQTALKEIDGGSETPNDLEEAANDYTKDYYDDCSAAKRAAYHGFIAGYKFHAEHAPLPEDTVTYNKGVAEGKRLMMEEAVEGEIQMRYSGCLCAKTIRAINEDKFKFGDKVRVVVIKEN